MGVGTSVGYAAATLTPAAATTEVPTVSVVLPALNEERNIAYVLHRLPEVVTQVILVDGGSTDHTVETAIAECPDIEVVQQTRSGKGNALACGFAMATGDIVVMIDADGSTDPLEIPRFVDALRRGADFAKGSRFRRGGGSSDITRIRRLGNDGLNVVVNTLFGTRYTDLCYGYNAFWREVVPSLGLPAIDAPPSPDGQKRWGDGFEVETLMNIRASTQGFHIEEVASFEAARRYGASNLNTFRDGRRVLRTVIHEFRNRNGAMDSHPSAVRVRLERPARPQRSQRSRRSGNVIGQWMHDVSAQASASVGGAMVGGRAVACLLLGSGA
jgi:glycosyltransferase involved in cell wall biosynthesis